MEENKVEKLISYLASLEFRGEKLESEIRKNINQGLSSFSVRHAKDYDEEQMLFDLRFQKDYQFDAYKLKEYKATYRKPIHIEYKVINGIDTGELEGRMKKIDWNLHFNNTQKYPENPKDDQIKKVISDLYELDAHQNTEGIKIQELLQLKYFPESTLDDWLKDLRTNYEQSRKFTATESGFCNAHLAYHLLSGRLDALYQKLQPLKLDQYPGIDIYSKLETILSGNPDSFQLKHTRNEPEGYVEYTVPVTKEKDAYAADTYTASLIPYPPIEHGVYNGIDSAKLEAMMQEVNWHNDRELFILQEDKEPEFLSEVALIQEQMYRLSQDMVGSDIADKLQLKYWTDASFFEGMVQQTAWDYLETLLKRVQQFPVETSAKTAVNLLNGRAAMHTSRLNPSSKAESWMRLDFSHKEDNGNYPMLFIEGFSKKELEDCLDLLPIDNIHFYPIRNALQQGDLLSVQLHDDRKVMLKANPEQKTIDVYTKDMRPIPVNLKLDPDWKPALVQKEKVPEKHQKMPYRSKSKSKHNTFSKQSKKRHRKGRGI